MTINGANFTVTADTLCNDGSVQKYFTGGAPSGWSLGALPQLGAAVVIEDWSNGLYEIFPGYTVAKDQHIMAGDTGGGDLVDGTWSVVSASGVRSTDTQVYRQVIDEAAPSGGDVNIARSWWRPKTATINGLWYAHEYTKEARDAGNQETADSWQFDYYNRMRVWVKLPAEFNDPGTNISGQFDMGTYVREYASGDYNNQEGGSGWHYYHKANIYAGVGVNGWAQIIINFSAQKSRSDVYSSAPTFPIVEYPTQEVGYNYFDTLTNFYIDVGSKGDHSYTPPINFEVGMMEFYREESAYNSIHIGTPWGGYDAENNEVVVGWKGDLRNKPANTCYVRYSFNNIKDNGWASATAASGNDSVSVGAISYQDYRWKLTTGGGGVDITGQDVMYVAIADDSNANGNNEFEQIMIPLTQAGQDYVANYYGGGN